jgi:hypothetical protein
VVHDCHAAMPSFCNVILAEEDRHGRHGGMFLFEEEVARRNLMVYILFQAILESSIRQKCFSLITTLVCFYQLFFPVATYFSNVFYTAVHKLPQFFIAN